MKKASKQNIKDAIDSIYAGIYMDSLDYLSFNYVPYDNIYKAIELYPRLTMRQAIDRVYKDMPMTKGMLLNYHISLGLIESIHISLLNKDLYID